MVTFRCDPAGTLCKMQDMRHNLVRNLVATATFAMAIGTTAHMVAERADVPGIDPRLVKAVGIRDGQHFILLDIDALVAPII